MKLEEATEVRDKSQKSSMLSRLNLLFFLDLIGEHLKYTYAFKVELCDQLYLLIRERLKTIFAIVHLSSRLDIGIKMRGKYKLR